MTHLECNYTVAPLSDSTPVVCGQVGIRRVLWDNSRDLEMVYCGLHWKAVVGLPQMKGQTVEDLVEEQC